VIEERTNALYRTESHDSHRAVRWAITRDIPFIPASYLAIDSSGVILLSERKQAAQFLDTFSHVFARPLRRAQQRI
jgi:hypothetical protein